MCVHTISPLAFEERGLFFTSCFSGNTPEKPQAAGITHVSSLQAMVDTGKTMKALLKHVETFEPKMVKVAG